MKYEFTFKDVVYKFSTDDILLHSSKYYCNRELPIFGSPDFCESISEIMFNTLDSEELIDQFEREASDRFIMANLVEISE